jgi:hypothetical protein
MNKVNRLIATWKKQLLNLEISDTIRMIAIWTHENESLKHAIMDTTSQNTYSNFFNLQRDFYHKNLDEQKTVHKRKLTALRGVLLPPINLNFNERWLVNLTDIELPMDFMLLISLGEKFSINRGTENVPYFHLIADVENALTFIEDENQRCAIRSDVASMIKRYITNDRPSNSVDKFTNGIFDKSVNFVKNYEADESAKKFIAMRSDKGQQSVILYSEDYEKGMYKLLSDRNNYKIAQGDPTKVIATRANKLINKLFHKKIIDKSEKFRMITNNALPPKIYGLVKTHKPNLSRDNIILRPVVSYIGSPLYALSGYLGRILSKSLKGTFNVKNTYEFHKSILNKKVPPGFILASFYVVSLFTCIPQDFLLECCRVKMGVYFYAHNNGYRHL